MWHVFGASDCPAPWLQARTKFLKLPSWHEWGEKWTEFWNVRTKYLFQCQILFTCKTTPSEYILWGLPEIYTEQPYPYMSEWGSTWCVYWWTHSLRALSLLTRGPLEPSFLTYLLVQLAVFIFFFLFVQGLVSFIFSIKLLSRSFLWNSFLIINTKYITGTCSIKNSLYLKSTLNISGTFTIGWFSCIKLLKKTWMTLY